MGVVVAPKTVGKGVDILEDPVVAIMSLAIQEALSLDLLDQVVEQS